MILSERRHSRRYLTLKNGAITGIALAAAFILLSIWSELRTSQLDVSGRLFESRVPSSESPSAHHESVRVVQEGSIHDQPRADSILVDARATQAPDSSIAAPAAQQKNWEHRESMLGKGQRITISGGTEGVQMHVETAPAAGRRGISKSPPQF